MITIEPFGEKATLYRLENKAGLQVTLTDFGARIVDILIPVEENGGLRNVSLSAQSDKHYLETDAYPGSTIVPVAGRISGAQTEIAGKVYHFTENEPNRTLHGGVDTANEQYWQTDLDHEENSVRFSIQLADGFNGFPGNVRVQASYQLTEQNELRVTYQALSDAPTLFNPTNHVYFNLTGDFQRPVGDHSVRIAAERYAPLGADNLPTGELAPVAGTPFDFRAGGHFEQGFASDHPQNLLVKGYDHPWLVDHKGLVAEISSPDQDLTLRVHTDQDALVIYTYNFPVEELAAFHGAFSMECQALPNACNQEGFGSIVLEKDQVFSSQTVYQFIWK